MPQLNWQATVRIDADMFVTLVRWQITFDKKQSCLGQGQITLNKSKVMWDEWLSRTQYIHVLGCARRAKKCLAP